MYKKQKLFSSVLGGCILLMLSNSAYAQEPETYSEQIGLKATTGLANLTTSIVEVPKNIINVTNAKDSNIFYGLIGGTFKGLVVMVGRMAVGVTDLITFPLPTKPVAHPLYVWENFDTDTSFDDIFQMYESSPTASSDVAGIADDDGDGVANDLDQSPNTPKGAHVDEQGFWAYHGVFFDFDKADIKTEFYAMFDNAIEVMNSNPEVTVEIQGHTDNIGDAEYNMKLSERRAKAVKDYLVRHGVNAERMTVRGFGLSSPAKSNDTKEGRAYNRRVNFQRTDI